MRQRYSRGVAIIGILMLDAVEYRQQAKKCVDLAERVKPVDRPLLLDIAKAWLKMALQADMLDSVAVSEEVSTEPIPIGRKRAGPYLRNG